MADTAVLGFVCGIVPSFLSFVVNPGRRVFILSRVDTELIGTKASLMGCGLDSALALYPDGKGNSWGRAGLSNPYKSPG